ncbi:hypothetical protein PSE_4711 [Pseudovibrio sp. FO-BEG1]|nr:hypothetical protein PSE_4711 [Pseudovibrio sp. FO-BEG1]
MIHSNTLVQPSMGVLLVCGFFIPAAGQCFGVCGAYVGKTT